MRIGVDEISVEGMALDFTSDPSILSLEDDPEHIQLLEAVRFVGRATRVDRDVMVRGTASALVELSCSRCAEPFAFPLQCSVEVNYIYGPDRHNDEEEAIVEENEIDTVFYQGDAIDVTVEIRDNLLLSLPIKPLCKEDCLGLCPKCGTNLNLSTCQCSEQEVDPRFQVLKQWKSSAR